MKERIKMLLGKFSFMNRFNSCIILFFILPFLIFSLNPCNVIAQDLDQLLKFKPEDFLLSFGVRKVHKELIKPVVENLKQRSANDPALVRLLNNLDFTTEVDFRVPPNARAIAGGIVHVDFRFIAQNIGNARLIALEMTGDRESQRIGLKHRGDWKNSVRNAIRLGHETPPFIFPYWEVLHNPVQTKLVEIFSKNALQEFIAFVVLHEIGHHVLGHLKLCKTSPEKSRQLELVADSYAINKLWQLDYPLDLVYRFMLSLAEEDDFYDSLQPDTDHSQDSHPGFRIRAQKLANKYGTTAYKSTPISYYHTVYSRVDEEGLRHVDELILFFPQNPQEWGSGGSVVAVNDNIKFAAVEFVRGKAYIFTRDGNNVSTYIIHEPNARKSKLEIKYVALPGKREYLHQTVFVFRDTFAPFYSIKPKGISIDKLLNIAPLEYIDNATKRLGLTYSRQTRLKEIVQSHSEKSHKLWLDYLKGILSKTDLKTSWQNEQDAYKQKLQTFLGSDKYYEFIANYQGQEVIKVLISTSLEISDQIASSQRMTEEPEHLKSEFRNLRTKVIQLGLFELIDVTKRYGFYDKMNNPDGKGIVNDFKVEFYNGKKVVVDRSTRLMWQQSGSSVEMSYTKAWSWIERLNQSNFAGFNNWRLPTVVEAMTLVERGYADHGFFISGYFDRRQYKIWTCDYNSYYEYSKLYFSWAVNFRQAITDLAEDRRNNNYVRAVRTISGL